MKNYDKLMKIMTPELLAELGVKQVNVDNRRLFYMTSSGQLFSIDDYQSAFAHEYEWLMTDEDPDKAPEEAITDPSSTPSCDTCDSDSCDCKKEDNE